MFDVEELVDPRRLAPALLRTRRPAPDGSGGRRLLERERAAGTHRRRATPASRRRSATTKRGLLAFLVEARRAGSRSPATARRARPTRCSTTADPDRPPRLPGRSQPVQARPVHAGHAHPDPSRRAAAETRPDVILILPWNLRDEIAASSPTPESGARGWSCRSRDEVGESPMKVVLFCGGRGIRLREHSEAIPKPMVPIGYRPILWHVMRYYAHFGHRDFILCLGYRGDAIKDYFLRYERGAVERLRAVRRRPPDRAAHAPTSTTGGSPSPTPGSTPRSASGCAGSATTSRARRCSWPTTATP